MAQVTSLSVTGTPGRVHSFAAKSAASVLAFPCNITSTVDTIKVMASTVDTVKVMVGVVDVLKDISAQIDCDH